MIAQAKNIAIFQSMNIVQIKDSQDALEYNVLTDRGLPAWTVKAYFRNGENRYEVQIKDGRGDTATRFLNIPPEMKPAKRAELCKAKLEAISKALADQLDNSQLALPFSFEDTAEILKQKLKTEFKNDSEDPPYSSQTNG